jgi:hypothetical protein
MWNENCDGDSYVLFNAYSGLKVIFYSDGIWDYICVGDRGVLIKEECHYKWWMADGKLYWSSIRGHGKCDWMTQPPYQLKDLDKKLLEYIIGEDFERILLS